jgi:hypothetical protein
MKLQSIGSTLTEASEDDLFNIARPKVTLEFVKAMVRRKEATRTEARRIEIDIEHIIQRTLHYRSWNYPGGQTKLSLDIVGERAMRVRLVYVDEIYIIPILTSTLPDVQTIRDKLNRVSTLKTMEKQLQGKIARDQRTLKLRANERRI